MNQPFLALHDIYDGFKKQERLYNSTSCDDNAARDDDEVRVNRVHPAFLKQS